MTQHELIRRLEQHDPAFGRRADQDLDQELRRILALPRADRRAGGHRPRRRVALLAACAGVAVTGAVLLPGAWDGPVLAERAYAAVVVQDEVVHTVRRVTTVGEPAAAARPPVVVEIERWQRGEDLRMLIKDPSAGVVEQTLTDGTLTIKLPDGTIQRSGEGGLGEAISDIAPLIGDDPVTDFRKAYAKDGLTEMGPTTFEGRGAVRFALPERGERLPTGEVTTSRDFFVDPDTGAPLGSRYALAPVDQPNAPDVRYTTITEIDRFERLAPTQENLALLKPQR